MKTYKKPLLSLVAFVGLTVGSQSFAADGTISFKGQLTQAACTVKGSDSGTDFRVDLPHITTSALGTTKGTYAGHTAFSIKLTGCQSPKDSNITKVRVAFVGITDSDVLFAIKNQLTGDNAASGVALKLFQQDGKTAIDINNGNSKDKQYDVPPYEEGGTGGNIDLHYTVAYVNTRDQAPGAGLVEATATYAVEYN